MTLADWIIGSIALLALYVAIITRGEFLVFLERIGIVKSKAQRNAEFRKQLWDSWRGKK